MKPYWNYQFTIKILAFCAFIALGLLKAAATDPPWPMYQADTAHTGYVPVTLNTAAFALRWTNTFVRGSALNPVTASAGMVFVSQYEGDLYALDAATGNILWSTNYGSVRYINPPSYAYGNVYIQTVDEYSDTYLHAYQAASGAEVFRSPHPAQSETYLAPTPYNGNVYVEGGEYGGMYSFNAANGSSNWFADVGQYDGWTPAVDASNCYSFTGSGDSGPITGEFRIINRSSGVLQHLVVDNAFQWGGDTMNIAVTLGTNSDAFAAEGPGSIYPGEGPVGRLLMFDLRSDATHTPHIGWIQTNLYAGQVTLAKGVLYIDNGGSLAALDEVTGSPLWSWTPPSSSLTGTMIVTDNLLLARTSTTTYAIDLVSHQAVWSYPASGLLALGEGVLYLAGATGTLTAISAPSVVPVVSQPGGPYTVNCQGEATVVQLNGSASLGPPTVPLSFSWSANCPGASFDNPTSSTPMLTINGSAVQTCGVTLVVGDGTAFNTNQATVTVVDTTPPTIATNADLVLAASPGICYATNVSLTPPAASDNCALSSVTNNAPAQFPVGTNIVIWSAVDAAGNSSASRQRVIVQDLQPPVITTCPGMVMALAVPGVCYASNVALGALIATDNCGTVIITNNAPPQFPVGTNLVNWMVTDFYGNQSACQQLVVVKDTQTPTVACPADVTVPPDPGQSYASGVNLGTPLATDNCTVTSVTNDAPTLFPAGTNTVMWTATDSSGNTASCSQRIIVPMAELAITAAAQIGSGNGLLLTCTAPTGHDYSVQVLTNLTGGLWTTLPGTNQGNGGSLTFTVTNMVQGQPFEFFRVRQW